MKRSSCVIRFALIDTIFGKVTKQCVRSIPKKRRETVMVKEVMIPCERTVTIKPPASALDAMSTMAHQNIGRLLVLDGRRLLGIVTRGDFMRTIRTREELVAQ